MNIVALYRVVSPVTLWQVGILENNTRVTKEQGQICPSFHSSLTYIDDKLSVEYTLETLHSYDLGRNKRDSLVSNI